MEPAGQPTAGPATAEAAPSGAAPPGSTRAAAAASEATTPQGWAKEVEGAEEEQAAAAGVPPEPVPQAEAPPQAARTPAHPTLRLRMSSARRHGLLPRLLQLQLNRATPQPARCRRLPPPLTR